MDGYDDYMSEFGHRNYPFPEILELVDPKSLWALQLSLELHGGNAANSLADINTPFRGAGGSSVVRRVGFNWSRHQVIGPQAHNAQPKYVVVKKPIIEDFQGDEASLLRTVLIELKILRHEPISQHPNIVRLLQIRWDTQFGSGGKLAYPSLILEDADLGSLADFQDSAQLSSDAKKSICLDIARALQALHSHGIVHGDIKSE
jgi:serine/threonine protein kinase